MTARTEAGAVLQWRTRFVLDASGRDTLLATQFGWKQKNRRHNSAAVYGHFTGAQRLAGRAEGNISIFWFDHGWFWFIPLADGTTSIGAVCWPYYLKSRKTDVTRFFLDTIALCPKLAQRLENAALVEPASATGNYSYAARRASGRNYLMLGDALCVHRSRVLVRRVPRDEQCVRRRRGGRDLPRSPAPGAGRAAPRSTR